MLQRKIRLVQFVLVLLVSGIGVDSFAQSYRIFFPVSKSELILDYRSNYQNIESLFHVLDSVAITDIDSIKIFSATSPDGPTQYNRSLSEARRKSVVSFLNEKYPEHSGLFKVSDKYEDWDGFRALVKLSATLTDAQREQIVSIIDSDTQVNVKKAELKSLPFYSLLNSEVLQQLRYAVVNLHIAKQEEVWNGVQTEVQNDVQTELQNEDKHDAQHEIQHDVQEVVMDQGEQDDISAVSESFGQKYVVEEPAPVSTQSQPSGKREIFFMRTNLLAPLSNFGVEIPIGSHWSIGADYYFPWIFRNPNHRNCFQILGWNLEGRYWFGKDRGEDKRLEGHSVGLSATAGYYDIGRKYKGNQGEFASLGVDYLYSYPIFKDKMHLELSLGLGYLYSRVVPYQVYEDGGKAYRLGYRKNMNWWGPTKACVSIVVPIKANRRAGR